MQKPTFDKVARRNGTRPTTKPAQVQAGKEPDPAGQAGERASADAGTRSTPKAGTVTQDDQARSHD